MWQLLKMHLACLENVDIARLVEQVDAEFAAELQASREQVANLLLQGYKDKETIRALAEGLDSLSAQLETLKG